MGSAVSIDDNNKSVSQSKTADYQRLQSKAHQFAVEDFTQNAYLSGVTEDAGLKLIVTNPRARSAFLKFLTTQEIDFFKFFEDMDSISSPIELETAKSLVNQYKVPEKEANEVVLDNIASYFNAQATLMSDSTEPDPLAVISEQDEENEDPAQDDVADSVYNATNQAFAMKALSIYPKFIGSEAYKEWREAEAHDTTVMLEEIQSADVIESSIYPDSFTSRCFQYINPSAVDRLIGTGSWLTTFVTAAEGLPICVTLADADKSRPGFPLVYVNKVFELTSGYERERIRGTNCKFLQKPSSEIESISFIASGLSNALPVRVVITNFKKDGTPFKNLLAMKPIFDMQGKYCYVVGVQFDASSPSRHGSSVRMMKLVNKLLEAIPDSIPFGGTI
eukprot:gene12725-26807_t